MTSAGATTMDARTRGVFLALITAQAAHSIEEYCFRLYEVFAPARFLSGLFSDDLRTGFAVANVLLVLFGAWCYAAKVRPNRPSGRAFAWFWALLELGNGIGHTFFSLARQSYFPGVATAPLLLGVASYLCVRLSATTGDAP
jgi:hypothetical protein